MIEPYLHPRYKYWAPTVLDPYSLPPPQAPQAHSQHYSLSHSPSTQQPTHTTMSGKGGKSGKTGGKAGGDGSKSQSRSAKAGLQFPVGRVHRLLKKGNYAQRVGAGAPGKLLSFFATFVFLTRHFLQSTSQPSSNTSQPRFSNSLVTPLVITRNNVLCLVTCNSPSGMTKSESLPSFICFLSLTVLRLNKLLGDVVISQGGVVPHIESQLLPTKSGKGRKEDGISQEV